MKTKVFPDKKKAPSTRRTVRFIRPFAGASLREGAGLGDQFLFWLGKDHPPGRRLENTGDGHMNFFPYIPPPPVHNDHGPVFQVGNTLAVFLPLLDDMDQDLFAW